MKILKTIKYIIYIVISIFIFNACTSISFGTTNADNTRKEESLNTSNELSQIQKRLLIAAESYKNSNGKILISDDKTYNLDCSGAMLAIYYKSGIYLEKCYSESSGNGVKRIFSCLKNNNLVYISQYPEPGDLVFWDNTYDKNGDGKFNDYLTHIGMVINVDENGTITYIHDNYKKGLIYEKMNLIHPKNTNLNSPMRMKNSPKGPNNEKLAGELVRVFGQAWLLPKKYYR